MQNLFLDRNYTYITTTKINGRNYYEYICNKHKEEGVKRVRIDSFNKGAGCKTCATELREQIRKEKSIKEFVSFINLLNEYEVIGEYIDANTDIELYHKVCGKKFKSRPGHFKNGTRCPYCAGKYKTTDDFKKEVKELVKDSYSVLGEYISATDKILFIHNDCGHKYKVSPNKFLSGRRCPNCTDYNNSSLSQEIQKYLEDNNYDYKREYRFQDCKYKKTLPFDFAIFNKGSLLCLIEADGIQHEKPVEKFGGIDSFKMIQIRDKIKNEYCIKNNIKLIRIKHNQLKKVREILNKELSQV